MRKKNHQISDEAICAALYEVIREAGWAIPTDEESVAAAEARLRDAMPELPEELSDPQFPSADDSESLGKVVPLWDPQVLAAPMARAAREGGSVPSEIEQTMKRDRETAEKELRDQEKHRENDDR